MEKKKIHKRQPFLSGGGKRDVIFGDKPCEERGKEFVEEKCLETLVVKA